MIKQMIPISKVFIIAPTLVFLLQTAASGQERAHPNEAPFNRSASAIAGDPVRRWVIQIEPKGDIASIVKSLNATIVRKVNEGATVYVLDFNKDIPTFEEIRRRSSGVFGIISLEPQILSKSISRAVPIDPLLARQLHLSNPTVTSADIHILPVWNMTTGTPPVPVDGRGVTIGVVDDGFDFKHPDLSKRYIATSSFDVFGNPLDSPSILSGQSPCNNGEKFCHGTAVAGIASASANSIGGVGVASGSKLADLRLNYLPDDDDKQSAVEQFKSNIIAVKNNSWGYCDILGRYTVDGVYDVKNFQCGGGEVPFVDRLLPVAPGAALKSSLFDLTRAGGTGRGGLGTVFTWSAPNGGSNADRNHSLADASYQYVGNWGGYDSFSCNRYVIDVGALGADGKVASYSARSACILVVAPGGSPGAGIVTTDLRGPGNGINTAPSGGDYTTASTNFTGTSAAAPMVAGVAALILQVRPDLTYRDVMHILLKSTKKVDPSNPTWTKNGALRWVSVDYGFGLVDAAAAVKLAKTWVKVGPLVSYTSGPSCPSVPIPFGPTGTTFGKNVTARIKVEHVEIVVGVTHATPGDLQIKVKSPSNVNPVIIGVPQANRREQDLFYTFTTTNFWDELAPGFWTVTATDQVPGVNGVFECAKINIYGTAY